MKISLFILFVFQIGLMHAQFGPRQIVDNDCSIASSVFAGDLDGDGNNDILCACPGDNLVAWYKNMDGLGTFGSKQVIAVFDSLDFVTAADLDGDGDLDIISCSGAEDFIFWYENLDGLGSFDIGNSVTTAVALPKEVEVADIDGDGDLDLVSASRDDDKVAWYENLDGLGNFGPQIIISTNALSTVSIDLADIDGDNDIDVLATSGSERRLYWFENLDGLGSFGSGHIIIEDPVAGFFNSIFSIDIDGDSDIDVISVELVDGRVAWYENLDGLGTFGTLQTIDLTLSLPSVAYAFDVDNDGDNDVLSQSSPDMKIVWYENLDGLGNFSPQQIVTTEADGPQSIYASDFDEDGDLDLTSASNVDGTIAWYENLTILGVDENELNNFTIYPNPSSDFLVISETGLIQKIQVFDLLGKKINSFTEDFEQLDISNLRNGLYFLKIYSENEIYLEKFIKK